MFASKHYSKICANKGISEDKVMKHGAHCFVIEWNNWKSFEICKCDVSSSLSLLLEQNMCCPQHSQLLVFEVVLRLLV